MIFETQSGSSYEYDPDNKRIRRLGGSTKISSRCGDDGIWKDVVGVRLVTGSPAIIFWDPSTTPTNVSGDIPATQTSPVVSIDLELPKN